jgi:hypothetical protein
MSPAEIAQLAKQILSEPKEQLRNLQALRKTLTVDEVALLDAILDVALSVPEGLGGGPAAQSGQIVVALLHGIRTEAPWQDMVAAEIKRASSIEVFPIGYGWLDVLRFWWPWRTRMKPLERVLRELRSIRSRFPNADLVVVAHSFSTYLMSKVLEEHKDIRIARLLLCGSIIPVDYRWDKAIHAGDTTVVNEVGTRDGWPVFARVSSWGYGCSGTMGFKTSLVVDRYFDMGHSDFFTHEHVNQYWLPFLLSSNLIQSPWSAKRPTPGYFLSLLGGLPYIKLFLIGLVSLPVVAIVWWLR